MQYEFYITTDCNRNCAFCKIPKTKFYSSRQQVDLFYDIVQKEQYGKTDRYELSLFGGEPLLNYDSLAYIIDKFEDDNRCFTSMTTNGDKLADYKDSIQLHKIDNLTVSAYDFFINLEKYKHIHDIFKNAVFTYTFTENDLSKMNEFFDVCSSLRIKCKTTTSHSASSWKNISEVALYNEIFNSFYYQLEKFLETYSNSRIFNMQVTLKQYMLRLIQAMYYNNNLEDIWCICGDKKTFYNGTFIGKCLILEHNHDINLEVPDTCKKCQYRKACTKSCYFERLENSIDSKLCTIEKAKFDAICKFMIDRKNNMQFKNAMKTCILD